MITTGGDMYSRFARVLIAVGVAATASMASAQTRKQPEMIAGCPTENFLAWHHCALEKAKTFTPPRTPSGKPDLQGYWQPSRPVQDFSVEGIPEDHPSITALPPGYPGYAWYAGPSLIVEPSDQKIPYQPWAARIGRAGVNFREYLDPHAECATPGVPRLAAANHATSQILQPPTDDHVLWLREGQFRVIAVDSRPSVGRDVKTWNGLSRSWWEGNTLVIDTSNFNGYTWLDDSGNFYTDNARITERVTMVDRDTIHYQATIDDPTVYIRPWTMVWSLVRDTTPSFELFESACREGDRDVAIQLHQGFKLYYGVPWRFR